MDLHISRWQILASLLARITCVFVLWKSFSIFLCKLILSCLNYLWIRRVPRSDRFVHELCRRDLVLLVDVRADLLVLLDHHSILNIF